MEGEEYSSQCTHSQSCILHTGCLSLLLSAAVPQEINTLKKQLSEQQQQLEKLRVARQVRPAWLLGQGVAPPPSQQCHVLACTRWAAGERQWAVGGQIEGRY